jgi:hypothetical protein
MKCSEKGCPFPARRDGRCVQHLSDQFADCSVVVGSAHGQTCAGGLPARCKLKTPARRKQ